MTRCVTQKQTIPDNLLGPLRDSTDALNNADELRQRLHEDGYLFLRDVINHSDIMTAREEVFERLAEVGEIQQLAIDGIATGKSRRCELVGDLGVFWQSVNSGSALRHVSHGAEIGALMDKVLGEPARAHDFMFLRPGVVGRSTHLHYDYPFFARSSQRVYTVWTALGEIPVEDGALMVLEGSNQYDDLIEPIKKIDYESGDSPQVQMTDDTLAFVRERNSRLLTADFGAGDVALFDMFTMHGSLDNHSTTGRVRLSCDVRWQPAADPVDERYVGDNPGGTTGAGYGELNGAKPLTVDWHIR